MPGRGFRHPITALNVVSLVPVPELWLRRDPDRVGTWRFVYHDRRSGLPPILQVCVGDAAGRMPWEAGCDPASMEEQPILADDPLRHPPPPRHRQRHRRR